MKKYNLIIKWVCNTNCSFCNFFEQKEKINSKDHLIELIKELNKAILSWVEYIQIGYYWYEPTTFPFFLVILKYIKSRGLKVSLSTNAVLFANKTFTSKFIWLIDKVYITLYSSNNKEHFLYTQKKQSYLIKHLAISNLLWIWVNVKLNILLLKNTLDSLNTILLQTKKYWKHDYFLKNISIVLPSPEMDEIRMRYLIPSYVNTINVLNKSVLFFNNLNIIWITFIWDIPKCISKFFNWVQYSYNKSSLSSEYLYTKKCNWCLYKKDKSCKWINSKYYSIFWDNELKNSKLYKYDYEIITNKEIYKALERAKKLYI